MGAGSRRKAHLTTTHGSGGRRGSPSYQEQTLHKVSACSSRARSPGAGPLQRPLQGVPGPLGRSAGDSLSACTLWHARAGLAQGTLVAPCKRRCRRRSSRRKTRGCRCSTWARWGRWAGLSPARAAAGSSPCRAQSSVVVLRGVLRGFEPGLSRVRQRVWAQRRQATTSRPSPLEL